MVWSLLVIAMCVLAAPRTVAGNVSDLYGASGERWNPAGRLPDFSWAGYRGGEPVPAVPVMASVRDFGARGDGQADDTRAFQQAISTVKAGAILVPKGRYRITGVLEIAKPDLVLRGEGEGATVLFLEKPLKDLVKEVPYYGGLIRIIGKDTGQKITDVTSAARRGGTSLGVRSPKAISAGQTIRLRMRNPQDNSLGRYLYADQGALNAERRKWYDGQIVNWAAQVKNVAGGAIELARPLRLDVRPQWQPEIWSHRPTVYDVGIENLTIEFPKSQYVGHHKEEGYFAIYMGGAYDCWVRNLTIIDSDIGVVAQGGGRNEVTGVTLKTRWRTGEQTAGETGHYGLVATSHAQDCLFENCRVETTFVHNLSVNAFANGNVYSSTTCQTGRFDHHGGAPYENLFTDILITRNAGDLFMSGGNRADEPNAGARTTFWNIRTQGGKFPGRIMIHADGSPRLPQINIIGMDRWPTKKTATEEWIEQWPGETTQPPNLYRAQSANRRTERNRGQGKIAASAETCDLRVVAQVSAGQPLGQCRIVPLALGPGRPKALLAVFGEDVVVDPYEEMFFFPKDTLHLMAFTEKSEILWTRDLGRGVVPGIWFCPVFPFDLDGDGVDEIWLVSNSDADHPLTLSKRRLERLDARTGRTLGQWPWPPPERGQNPSYLYRHFILGGYVRGTPVLVTAQGTYQGMALQGWNADMTRRWELRIAQDEPGARGSHMCPVVDINSDDVDEVMWGERCIELDTGKELFCADRDSYRGHSDVVQPVWNPTDQRWVIYTCREGAGDVAPRVAVFDDHGKRLWGDLDKGHIDVGWVARVGEKERMAFAVRIGGKSAGPKGLVRKGVEEFTYDVFTGKQRTFPVNLLGRLPVDLDGDGVHEFVGSSDSNGGLVLDARGRERGRFKGAVAAASKILDRPGEQLVTYTRDGTIAVWADANARDCEAAKWRYRHRFYKANQRLTAAGSNRINLGGL